MIKIQAEKGDFDAIIFSPVSEKLAKKFARRQKKNGGSGDETIFLQLEQEKEEFLELVPPSKRKDLRKGWKVVFFADPWHIAHYWGYDVYKLFEGGETSDED